MIRFWIFPLALAATVSEPVSSQTGPASRVDWPRIADLVINQTLKLAPGERVVLFWDQASDRGTAPALRSAITAAGGVIAAEITPPGPPELEAARRLAPAAQALQKARRDSIWSAAFAGADAAIWLPTGLAPVTERPFERLVERSKVRSIHFHWFLPPDTADVPAVEAMYAAAVSVAPDRLRNRIEAVETAVRGATVTITAPNGTNLTLKVLPNAWVHRNTGDASRAKVAGARSVRDRQEELPASVFRTTDIAAVEGTYVGYSSFDTRSPILKVTFAKGRVTAFESSRGADAIVSTWQKATGDKAVPGELVIGTNPALTSVMPSGFMPYYGYGAGVVRLAVGDNWESGGKNRSSNGEVLLFIPNATVTANGRVVVKDGQLMVGK